MARRYTGPSDAVRAICALRDCGECVVCGCPADVLHHRRPRAMGGTRREDTNYPSNLLTVCADDHTWIENRREEALEMGFLVPQWATPSKWAIAHQVHGVVFLEDDGTVTSVDEWEPDEASA